MADQVIIQIVELLVPVLLVRGITEERQIPVAHISLGAVVAPAQAVL